VLPRKRKLPKARRDLAVETSRAQEARAELLKTDGEERTQLHKLLIDFVTKARDRSNSSHIASDRTELIGWPPSYACCTS
jgi:hypothetical protein